MDNDGVLRIRKNSSEDALVIDDETGNIGVGIEFNTSSKLYVYSEDITPTSNPRYGTYSYLSIPGTGSRFGVYGNVEGNTGQRYGVFGRANSTDSGHYGMYCNGKFLLYGYHFQTLDSSPASASWKIA